jgi:hypothetical protein
MSCVRRVYSLRHRCTYSQNNWTDTCTHRSKVGRNIDKDHPLSVFIYFSLISLFDMTLLRRLLLGYYCCMMYIVTHMGRERGGWWCQAVCQLRRRWRVATTTELVGKMPRQGIDNDQEHRHTHRL